MTEIPLSDAMGLPDTVGLDGSLSLRLLRWHDRGARQDTLLQARAVTAAMLVGCGLATWIGVALYLR